MQYSLISALEISLDQKHQNPCICRKEINNKEVELLMNHIILIINKCISTSYLFWKGGWPSFWVVTPKNAELLLRRKQRKMTYTNETLPIPLPILSRIFCRFATYLSSSGTGGWKENCDSFILSSTYVGLPSKYLN